MTNPGGSISNLEAVEAIAIDVLAKIVMPSTGLAPAGGGSALSIITQSSSAPNGVCGGIDEINLAGLIPPDAAEHRLPDRSLISEKIYTVSYRIFR
ncbi:hypothetical protein ABS772_17660 [Methylorubrum podarium]|uniref:Uncharacterized protein n=1 Tax=Methylorubrum podarium TaxID=200476 RepID=A0ABV1QQR3_9HYPH